MALAMSPLVFRGPVRSRAIDGGLMTARSLGFFFPPVAAAMMIISRPKPAAPPPA